MKIILMGLLSVFTVSAFAGEVKDLMDSHIASSLESLSSAKHTKNTAKKLLAERGGCTTLGYVYGRASVDERVILSDGRNLLEVLNPAMAYCNQRRLSGYTKIATLEDAIKALKDAERNL